MSLDFYAIICGILAIAAGIFGIWIDRNTQNTKHKKDKNKENSNEND